METRIFATLNEARATVEMTEAKPLSETLYRFSKGFILISGIGSVATLTSLASLPKETSHVVSYGLAGALHENLQLETFYEIGSVEKFFSFPDAIDSHSKVFGERAFPKLTIGKAPYRLMTADYPIHREKAREDLKGDFVDMEGYAIAYFCKKRGLPLKMLRLTSDFAKEATRGLIQQKLEHYSELLSKG